MTKLLFYDPVIIIFSQNSNNMSNLHDSYVRIYALFHELEPRNYVLRRIRKPKLSDRQPIELTLSSESPGIDIIHRRGHNINNKKLWSPKIHHR